ncbi:MAG: gluconokinase, GntK/IdnK-type [Rhodothermales bacterium]
MHDAPHPTVLVLIGVSGIGKTSVGRAVAEQLGWAFFDADDFHPAANVAKMRAGEGLTDADRDPWLDAVRAVIERGLREGTPLVLACSALRASYRARLHAGHPQVQFVWLDVAATEIAERLASREDHFAGPDLLASQLDTWEPPARHEAVHVRANGTVNEVARRVVATLALPRISE